MYVAVDKRLLALNKVFIFFVEQYFLHRIGKSIVKERMRVVGEEKKEFRPHTLIYYCHKMCHKFSNKQKSTLALSRRSLFRFFNIFFHSIQLKLQLKTFPSVCVASFFFECEMLYELKGIVVD